MNTDTGEVYRTRPSIIDAIRRGESIVEVSERVAELTEKLSKPVLICTVGLPRSGKTTWATGRKCPIVNPDSIRLALHGQRFVAIAEPFVWAMAKVMVRALFLAGHKTVILDATSTTKKRRAEWIDDAWTTSWAVLDTTIATCLERAVNDAEIQPVIERMAAQFEPLDEEECPHAITART